MSLKNKRGKEGKNTTHIILWEIDNYIIIIRVVIIYEIYFHANQTTTTTKNCWVISIQSLTIYSFNNNPLNVCKIKIFWISLRNNNNNHHHYRSLFIIIIIVVSLLMMLMIIMISLCACVWVNLNATNKTRKKGKKEGHPSDDDDHYH